MNSSKENVCISIVVPIFNAEKYLVKCLDSIVNQTYKNLEIILVDDGSTDKSLDICREYEEHDDRIKAVHIQNSGHVVARKVGVANATGDYITFVDSDDYIDLDAYEVIVESIDSEFPDIVAYGLIEEYSDYRVKKANFFQNRLYREEEIKQNIFPKMLKCGQFFEFGILPNLVCKFFKKDFWDKTFTETSEKVLIGEDADLVFQLMVCAKMIQFVDVEPYHYSKRNDSVMWKSISEESIIHLKNDLTKAFQRTGCLATMQEQLNDYIAFITLLKRPELILNDWDIFRNKRIALYGAGGFGQAVHATYSSSITQWVDKSFLKYRDAGLQVNAVECLISDASAYDVIFIAILNANVCKSIKSYLREQGIEKEIYYYEG